jgi:hypothetical protein
VPVADQLFKARATHGWERARANALSVQEDPYGDIAEELGDEALAATRFELVRSRTRDVLECDESRVVYFLGLRGLSSALSWQWVFLAPPDHPFWKFVSRRLGGGTFLLYESVWMNRRLGRSAQADLLVSRLREAAGVRLERAFAHGKDALDCGGETPGYIKLFPAQARQMALDWWGRDSHRAQAVLSLSPRASMHIRNSIPGVEVMDFASLCVDFEKSQSRGVR